MTFMSVVPGAVSHREVTYAARTGYRPLLLDVHVPADAAGPVPCVVWVHGGAWQYGDRRDTPDTWPDGWWFTELVRAGLAVATVDYRFTREARWPAQIQDVRDAVAWVRANAGTLGVDPARLGVSGESAGGHLAAMVALTGSGPTAVQAAAVLYGICDVSRVTPPADLAVAGPEVPEVDLLGGRPADLPREARDASPLHQVTATTAASCPPMLLIHGDSDGLVPVEQSTWLHEALVAAGAPDVVLEVVPGADHCFGGVDPVPALRTCVDFLADRLGA